MILQVALGQQIRVELRALQPLTPTLLVPYCGLLTGVGKHRKPLAGPVFAGLQRVERGWSFLAADDHL